MRIVFDCECLLLSDGCSGDAAQQSKAMVEKYHIYMTGNGRISMAGLVSDLPICMRSKNLISGMWCIELQECGLCRVEFGQDR